MANPKLTVEIGADLTELGSGMNKAASTVEKGAKQMTAATGQVDKSFDKLSKDVSKSMSNVSSSTSKASNDVSKSLARVAQQTNAIGGGVSKGANEASVALTNFGRIAQDLPYGMMGISNNLNPMIESFGRLRKETGSTGGALKAMASGLMGAGGLGIAVSAISAAMSFAAIGMTYWKSRTAEAKEEAKEFADTLNEVASAQLKGSQNAQQDLTNVRLLYKAYQDANRPLKERQEAYSQLQEKYPAYFANLKFEETASNATEAAYNRLTTSILASARARAAADKIAENASRQLEDEIKIINLQGQRAKLVELENKEISKRDLLLEKAKNAANIEIKERLTLEAYSASKAQIYKNQILDIDKQIFDLATDRSLLDKQNRRLEKLATDEIVKGNVDTKNSIEKVVKAKKELEKVNSNILAPAAGGDLVASANERLANRANPEAQLITTLRPPVGLTEYEKLLKRAEESNDRFIESLNEVGKAALSSGIGDAFNSIGEALATGGNFIDAAGNAILSVMANFLNQLGQMFIKEGIAQIAFGVAQNLILPGSGANRVAGGVGMIAAGGLISIAGGAAGARGKGKSAKDPVKPIRAFSTGGYNLPSGMALVGERGPEIVNLPTGSDVYNNNKTMGMLRRANNDSIVLQGDLGISLETLYFRLKKVEQNVNR